MNLILLPLPKAPTYGALRVNTSKIARTDLQATEFPLTKIVQLPSFMRRAVPLIGQSSNVAPAFFNRRNARSLSSIGSVLVSITIKRALDLGFASYSTAISWTTSSSAATDGNDVMTISTTLATFAHDERA